MAQITNDVPWWRVIKADGSLATAKRDPRLEDEQTSLLNGEGVPFCRRTRSPQLLFPALNVVAGGGIDRLVLFGQIVIFRP